MEWYAIFQVMGEGGKRLYSIEITIDRAREVVKNHEFSGDDFSIHIVEGIGWLGRLVEELR